MKNRMPFYYFKSQILARSSSSLGQSPKLKIKNKLKYSILCYSNQLNLMKLTWTTTNMGACRHHCSQGIVIWMVLQLQIMGGHFFKSQIPNWKPLFPLKDTSPTRKEHGQEQAQRCHQYSSWSFLLRAHGTGWNEVPWKSWSDPMCGKAHSVAHAFSISTNMRCSGERRSSDNYTISLPQTFEGTET